MRGNNNVYLNYILGSEFGVFKRKYIVIIPTIILTVSQITITAMLSSVLGSTIDTRTVVIRGGNSYRI